MAAENIPTIVQCIIDPDGKNIIVDVTMSEDHTYEADISSYPIEAGGDITDNVRIKPLTVKWECIISDTPINADGGQTTIFGALPQVDAYNQIVALFKARNTITIQDSLDVFVSMMITSVSIPRTAQNGSALVFSINFQQVEILENQRDTVVVHLGGQGSKILPGVRIPCFSRPTSERAQFAKNYKLLSSDETPPPKEVQAAIFSTFATFWDHWDVVAGSDQGQAGFSGTSFVDQTFRNAQGQNADGWWNGIYHPFGIAQKQAGIAAHQVFGGNFGGTHYDVASGKYVTADGKPVTQDPGAAMSQAIQKGVNQGATSTSGFKQSASDYWHQKTGEAPIGGK